MKKPYTFHLCYFVPVVSLHEGAACALANVVDIQDLVLLSMCGLFY